MGGVSFRSLYIDGIHLAKQAHRTNRN